MGGIVKAPALATLRIIDGREGREEAIVMRSRVFQLQADEARVQSEDVAGMYHNLSFHAFIIYALCLRHVMFELFKSPPKNRSCFMILWILLLRNYYMPFCIPRVMVRWYLDESV